MIYRRYLELALIALIVGAVSLAVKLRLDDVQREARRVQLLMAAETVRSNGALMQLRCPNLADNACAQRALGQLHRASATAPSALEPATGPSPESQSEALDRLQAIASAAGLAQHGEAKPQWQLRVLDAQSLEVALTAVTDCRFVMRWDAKASAVSIEDIHPRC
jgi:hypothetical protein